MRNITRYVFQKIIELSLRHLKHDLFQLGQLHSARITQFQSYLKIARCDVAFLYDYITPEQFWKIAQLTSHVKDDIIPIYDGKLINILLQLKTVKTAAAIVHRSFR